MKSELDKKLRKHIEILENEVFFTKNKWPHFSLLLKDMSEFSLKLKANLTVVSLERTLLYGGYSLLAPFFDKQNFISIDCSPSSADDRGSYNEELINNSNFIKISTSKRADISNTGLEDCLADLVLIPNLVHHIADQDMLFQEMARILKPGGKVYIFEPLVRELHQIPDDFLRYTPFGIAAVLKKVGLEMESYDLEGGPFSVIAYCWTQALQYFPDQDRKKMEDWFYNQHFIDLMKWDIEHTDNKVRPFTKFPMSFSIKAIKN